MKATTSLVALLGVFGLVGAACSGTGAPPSSTPSEATAPPPAVRATVTASPGQGASVPSTTPDPPLPVLSRTDALPSGYVPDDLVLLDASLLAPGYGGLRLVAPAAQALAEMLRAAAGDGVILRTVSAYRSFEEQSVIHQRAVERSGTERAERISAKPGHSEHQLGTTVDLSAASVAWRLSASLATTAEGAWLDAHAHEYGFALSYPAGAEDVTGYAFEPWHARYIGRDHAARWKSGGQPLITYLRTLGR